MIIRLMLLWALIFFVLSSSTTTRQDLPILFNRNMISILITALFMIIKCLNYLVLKEGVSLFGGLFHNTNLCIMFHGFTIIISLIIIQLTAFLTLNTNDNTDSIINTLKTKEQYRILEYPLIILFIIIGGIFLISCSDIISVFLSIELQSYGLYLLCALYRNSESSTEGALTYFLLGGLSSCFILLASGILYANSGTSGLDNYYLLTNLSDIKYTIDNMIYWYNHNYLNYSLVIISIGFLFKISAAPFHFWSPDVYDAIPTVVTTYVANIAKISLLIFLTELVHYTGNFTVTNFNWTDSLLLSSLLSLLVGTILGLTQTRIKRLLAYSTISHLGFMLLAVAINSIESIQAFLFYLIQYSISNINVFIIIISIGYTTYGLTKIDTKNKSSSESDNTNNSPIQLTSQLNGYYYINPLIAISLTIVMFSFVGIPPLIGFFGKQMVLSSALEKGYIFITLIAILSSVISAVYYLNIVKEIFFSKPEKFPVQYIGKHNKIIYPYIILSTNTAINIATLTLIILLFMTNADQYLRITSISGINIFN